MPIPLTSAPALTFTRENWFYVPSGGFANYLAPTATELVAASVLDFTNCIFGDFARPSHSVNRVEAARRLGVGTTYERRGARKIQGGTLNYAMDPQAVAASAGKKAFEKFLGGPSGGYLAQRLNVDVNATVVTGQFVKIYPADLSESLINPSGDDESGEVTGTCEYFLTQAESSLVALL